MVSGKIEQDDDGRPVSVRLTDDEGNTWLIQIIESREPPLEGWIVCERAGNSSPAGRLKGNLFRDREDAERELVRLIEMRAATGIP